MTRADCPQALCRPGHSWRAWLTCDINLRKILVTCPCLAFSQDNRWKNYSSPVFAATIGWNPCLRVASTRGCDVKNRESLACFRIPGSSPLYKQRNSPYNGGRAAGASRVESNRLDSTRLEEANRLEDAPGGSAQPCEGGRTSLDSVLSVITSYSSFIRVERLGQAKQVQRAGTNRAPIGYPRAWCPCPTSTYTKIAHGNRGNGRRGSRRRFPPVAKKSERSLFKSVGERPDQWAATGSPNWWIVLVMVDGRWQLLMSSTAFLVFVSLVFAATVARGALNLNLIFKVGRSSGEQRLSREKKVGVRLVWARFERSAEGNLFEYGGVRAEASLSRPLEGNGGGKASLGALRNPERKAIRSNPTEREQVTPVA
ncbi:hypothetical protein EAG_09504 [Camponotus floridanus]|uniref:Uncharacterized protein n=1 Tax=Camponotus floridanus TaxID=104421 RepID=E1ZZ72_CAMFO|nr:hypothetical protein EAG_09504 [Camponotus floridanus]